MGSEKSNSDHLLRQQARPSLGWSYTMETGERAVNSWNSQSSDNMNKEHPEQLSWEAAAGAGSLVHQVVNARLMIPDDREGRPDDA